MRGKNRWMDKQDSWVDGQRYTESFVTDEYIQNSRQSTSKQ